MCAPQPEPSNTGGLLCTRGQKQQHCGLVEEITTSSGSRLATLVPGLWMFRNAPVDPSEEKPRCTVTCTGAHSTSRSRRENWQRNNCYVDFQTRVLDQKTVSVLSASLEHELQAVDTSEFCHSRYRNYIQATKHKRTSILYGCDLSSRYRTRNCEVNPTVYQLRTGTGNVYKCLHKRLPRPRCWRTNKQNSEHTTLE